jgi:hypothetical protein
MIYIQAVNFTEDEGLEGKKREIRFISMTILEMPLKTEKKIECLTFPFKAS